MTNFNTQEMQDRIQEENNELRDTLEDFVEQLRIDNNLVNIHSGLGVAGKDILSPHSTRIEPFLLSPQQRTIVRHNSFAFGNLVEILPAAMCAKFVSYSCKDTSRTLETEEEIEKLKPVIQSVVEEVLAATTPEFTGELNNSTKRLELYLFSLLKELVSQSQLDVEMTIWMQKQLKKVKPFIQEALEEAREQGGAGLIIYADDDAGGIDKPLNLLNLREILGYGVLSSEDLEVTETDYETDINSINYGEIKSYRFTSLGSTLKNNTIHASRVIPFHGRKVNKKLMKLNRGWGYSVIDRAYVPVNNFLQGSQCIASSLQSFSQTVLFIQNLARDLAVGKREQVKEHLKTVSFLRNVLGIMALDAEHRYELMSRNYSNIEKILEHLAQMAAGACDLPLTLLLNRSNSDALNSALVSNNSGSSGGQSRQDWSDYVFARQGSDLMPQLEERLIPILHACKNSPLKGKTPATWELNREPIHSPAPQEDAKTKEMLARAIALLVDRGVLIADEVAQALSLGIDVFKAIDMKQRAIEKEQSTTQLTPEQIKEVVSSRMQSNLSESNNTQEVQQIQLEKKAIQSSPQVQI